MNGAFGDFVNGDYGYIGNMMNGDFGYIGYMMNGDNGHIGYMMQEAQRAYWEEGGWEQRDGEAVGERVLHALQRHEDLEQGGLRAAAPAFRPPCDWTQKAMRDLMARPGWPAVRRAFGIGMMIGGLLVLLIVHSVLGVVNVGHGGEQNFKQKHLFEKCMASYLGSELLGPRATWAPSYSGPELLGPRAPLREAHGHLFEKCMASYVRSEDIGYLGPELEIALPLARVEGHVKMTLEGGDDLSFESVDASLLDDNLMELRDYGFSGSLDGREELIVKPSEFIGIPTELRVEKPKKEVALYAPGASRAVWAKKRIAGIAARIAASRIAPDSSLNSSSNSSSSGSGMASSSIASRIARIDAKIDARIADADCAMDFVSGGERRRKSAHKPYELDRPFEGVDLISCEEKEEEEEVYPDEWIDLSDFKFKMRVSGMVVMALFCCASGVVVMAFFCRVLKENFERDKWLVIEYSSGETRASRRKLTRQQVRKYRAEHAYETRACGIGL